MRSEANVQLPFMFEGSREKCGNWALIPRLKACAVHDREPANF